MNCLVRVQVCRRNRAEELHTGAWSQKSRCINGLTESHFGQGISRRRITFKREKNHVDGINANDNVYCTCTRIR